MHLSAPNRGDARPGVAIDRLRSLAAVRCAAHSRSYKTPRLRHTSTAGPTSKAGLGPASAPTQPRLRHDHHGHPPFLDITAQPPRSGLSTHSAPFGLDHSDRPSRAPLLYITACSSTPHSSRTENLRPSAAASPHKPYDSNIMLAMLEPATRTPCSPRSRRPRPSRGLLHHA